MVDTGQVHQYAASKCKVCKLKCPHKENLLQYNKNQTCVIPFHKAYAIENKQDAILEVDNSVLDAWSTEYLLFLRDQFITEERIQSKNAIGHVLFNKINEYKQTFKPEPTRNINYKVEMQAQQVADRIHAYLEDRNKKAKVIDVKKKDDRQQS